MEGVQVVVKVVNEFIKEGFIIYWYGIYMWNNVWMDGVFYVM